MKVTFTVKGVTPNFWETFSALPTAEDKFTALLIHSRQRLQGDWKTSLKIGDGSVRDACEFNMMAAKKYSGGEPQSRRGYMLVCFDVVKA